jgi:transcriptional regulator with XRE-family HTH domain
MYHDVNLGDDMAETETMGQKLKALREAACMTQKQLATAAGIPLGTLRNWEQDYRSPLLSTAGLVARALRVSLDELYVPPEPKKKPRRPRKP